MRKNQVCVADDPKAHTTKFVNVKDLILDEEKGLTLGQFLTSQTNKIEELEKENKVLKDSLKKQIAITAMLNTK